MLIEILGNSSSLLALLLLGLSVYFGIKSKIKKTEWLNFSINKQGANLKAIFKRDFLKGILFE